MDVPRALCKSIDDRLRARDVDGALDALRSVADLRPVPSYFSSYSAPGYILSNALDTALALGIAGPPLEAVGAVVFPALAKHGLRAGLPFRLSSANDFGSVAIDWLLALVAAALEHVEREDVALLKDQAFAFRLFRLSLENLFGYEKDADVARIVAGLLALDWTDDRRWLLWRTLSESRRADPSHPLPKTFVAAVDDRSTEPLGDGGRRLRRWLVEIGVARSMAGIQKAPRPLERLPLTLEGALSLRAKWKLTDNDILVGDPAPPREIAKLRKQLGRALPREVTEMLRSVGEVGDAIGAITELAGLQEELAGEIEEQADEAHLERVVFDPGDIDARALLPVTKCFAIGRETSGDLFVLAIKRKGRDGRSPVLRLLHDQALTARAEARSIGEFIARLFATAYAEREGARGAPADRSIRGEARAARVTGR